RLYDLTTTRELAGFPGHAGPILAVAFGLDGRHALSIDHGSIRVWDAGTGKEVRTIPGAGPRVYTSASFSPDCTRAVPGGFDGMVRLWDVEAGKEMRCFRGHRGPVSSVALSPDGSRVLSTGSGCHIDGKYVGPEGDTFFLWDVATGRERHRFGGRKEDLFQG